jgi:hypothetical protein
MFKLKDKISASHFDIFEDNLITLSGNTLRLYNRGQTKLIDELDHNPTNLFPINNGIFVTTQDNDKTTIINTIDISLTEINNASLCPISEIDRDTGIGLCQNWLSYYPIEIESKFLHITTNNVLWASKNITSCALFNKNVISIEHDNLVFYDIQNGHRKAETNLNLQLREFVTTSQLRIKEKIQHYIGIIDNTLWIALSSGRLFAIDLSSGTIKDVIDASKVNTETKDDSYIPYGEFMQLDKESNEMIGLRGSYFMKIDLSSTPLKRQYIDVSASFAQHKLSASFRNFTFPIDKKHIYFCDDRSGKVAVFDRDVQKVIWSTALDIENEGIAKIIEMKVSNNIWCILDRNNTLHLLERI